MRRYGTMLLRYVSFTLLLLLPLFSFSEEYKKIRPIAKQKEAFVEILLPKIQKANADILEERAFVKSFFARYIFTWSELDRESIARLIELKKRYKIKHLYNKEEYLHKIDTIPTALVLAQASVESSWGKSRFVELANNIFGVWTYGNKGIIPENRPEGMKHKIKIYDSIDDAIAAYMLNLNRNRAYHKFRDLRAEFRRRGEKFRGVDAATTMANYSGIGTKYNDLLITMIKSNHFDKYE